ADDFGADHAVRGVDVLRDRAALGRFDEARPAGAGIELVVAFEQGLAAPGTHVLAGSLVLLVLPGEGALGSTLAQHGVLLGRQPLAPLSVGKADLLVAHRSLLSPLYGAAPPSLN